ncbi:MAG: hypothetical protein EA378_10780 [Phycisphaerales bacterium]|nr:MAG: hypothetical protein EA378_10780 [Phycisphaerales bacterium]
MASEVFLDGEFLDRGDARVSAFDAGVQHGVGLFETMSAVGTAEGARVFRLWHHMDRLATSARALGLTESIDADALGEAVGETVRRSGLAEGEGRRARVRLTITGGDLNLLQSEAKPVARPTVLIHVQPATAYPEAMFDRGVTAAVADLRLNPFDPTQGHKTLNYWARLRELQRASGRHAGEALVFQVTNHLAGGAVSNAVLVRDGVVMTPIARGEEQEVAEALGAGPGAPPRVVAGGGGSTAAMPSPVLPGVTRRFVLATARAQGLRVERRMLTIDDVFAADEVMLTNSSWGVLPVVRVEQHLIATGEVGEVTRLLRAAWLAAETAEPEEEGEVEREAFED